MALTFGLAAVAAVDLLSVDDVGPFLEAHFAVGKLLTGVVFLFGTDPRPICFIEISFR